jgi:hypothetical protein
MKKKYIVPDTSAVKLYTINGLLQEAPIVGSPGQSHDDQLIKSHHETNSEEKDWGDVDKSIW